MQVELRIGGQRGQARGQRGGEGAGRGRWRGQACTGTVAGRVGELLGVGLRDPGVTHVGGQVEALLRPHGHAPLLLDLLRLLDLLLLPLPQVIAQHLALPLRQHLSVDGPLEGGGGGGENRKGHVREQQQLDESCNHVFQSYRKP